jgi:hypothetical protein
VGGGATRTINAISRSIATESGAGQSYGTGSGPPRANPAAIAPFLRKRKYDKSHFHLLVSCKNNFSYYILHQQEYFSAVPWLTDRCAEYVHDDFVPGEMLRGSVSESSVQEIGP